MKIATFLKIFLKKVDVAYDVEDSNWKTVKTIENNNSLSSHYLRIVKSTHFYKNTFSAPESFSSNVENFN